MADAQANINVNVNTADALAQIRALQRQLSGFYSEMAKGGALASAQAGQMQQSLVNSINSTGKFSASMTTVRSTTEGFTNALEKNKLSMGQYFRFAGGSSQTFGKLFKSEFDTINKVARERTKSLQTQFVRLGRDANGAMQAIKVRPLALDMENLGTKVQMTAQRQQLFNQLVKQGSTNLLNFGKNTQWAGRQLMVGFTIPLTLFGTAATRAFQKIEEQAIKFRRVYGDMFTTTADTEKALSNVRELAEEFTKYGIAVEKTMDLAAKVAQMGNVGKALEEQVTQATRLSVLGGMEQMDALDTTISLTNAFGISIEDLASKIDFLNAAENQTILAIEDFNTAIPLTGTVINELGGSVEDLAVLLTAMREAGINASQGGNALKSSLARLIAPSRNAKETLSGFGIDVMGIVEGNAGNLMGTVMALGRSLDELDPLSRARSIEALFGKFQFARMSALFSNITREGSQANKVLELTQNSAQELAILSNRELGRVEESAATKFQKTLEKIQSALAPIGEEFLKAITPIVEFATRLLKQFNNLSDGTKAFVTNIVGFVGLIAPVFLMGLGLVFNLIANGIKAFQFLGRVLVGLSGQSKMLGGGLDYLSQEQLEGLAASASLEQAHVRLAQAFTSETSAVMSLAAAYRQANAASSAFGGRGLASAAGTVRPQGFADGKAVPGYSKGKSVPGYSSGVFMVPGRTSDGDAQPAMLTAGEAVISEPMTRKYGPLINAMIAGKIPGYAFGKEVGIGEAAKGVASRIVSPEASQKSLDSITSAISKRIESAMRNFGLSLEDATKKVSSAFETIESSSIKTSSALAKTSEDIELRVDSQKSKKQELHSDTGVRGTAKDFAGKMGSSSGGKLIDTIAHVNPEARINIKSGFTRAGSAYANSRLSADQSMGLPAQEGLDDYNAFGGVEKYSEAIKFGGGDLSNKELMQSFTDYDNKMRELQEQAINRKENAVKFFVDTEADIDKLISDGRVSESQRSEYASYESFDREASKVLSPDAAAVRDRAKGTAKTVRYKATAADIAKAQQMVSDSGDPRAQEFLDTYSKGGAASAGVGRERSFGKGGQDLPADVSFQDGVEDANAYSDGVESAQPEDISNIARRLAGRQSPHPDAFPDGADDAKDYLKGQESVIGSGSDAYRGSPLAPPPPPTFEQPAESTGKSGIGKRLATRFEDSSIGKGIGKRLAKASGNAVTDSSGQVYYDPNEDMSTWAGQMTAKDKKSRANLPGGENYSPDLGSTVSSGVTPVRVVNQVEFSPELGDALESGSIQSENLADTMAKSQEITKKKQRQDADIIKESKRQNRQRGAGRALGVLGTATMVAGMATQVEGRVGEVAQQVVGPLAALSGILPILMSLGPVLGSLVAIIGLVAAGFFVYNKTLKDTAKETYELQRAMGTSKKAIQSFAEFSGKVTQTELYQEQRKERFNPFVVAAGKSTFGENFAQEDVGQALIGNIRKSLADLGRDQTITSIFLQLGQAIGEGALSIPEARSIATALGNQLGDMSFGMEVNANLMRLLGPGGEDLLAGDRLTILADLREERQRTRADMEYSPITGNEDRTVSSDRNLRRSEIVESLGGGFGGTVAAFFSSGEWHKLSFELATGIGAAKDNMEQLSTILAQGVNDADFYASQMAAVEAVYGDSLEKAYASNDLYEINRLESERSEELQKILADRQASQTATLEELQKDIPKTRIAMKEALAVDFGDDQNALAQYTNALKQIQEIGLEEDKTLQLEYMLTSGDMPFKTAMAIVENYERMPEISNKIVEIQTKFGGDFSGDASELFNVFKEIDEVLADRFILSLDTTDIDKYQKQIEGFGAVASVQALFPEGEDIILKYVLENPEEIDRINDDINNLKGIENKDVTIDFIAQHFGDPALSAAKAIWDEIPVEDRKDALYSIIASMGVVETPEFQELFNALQGQTIAGVTISKPADILSMLGSRVSGVASGNRGIGGGDQQQESSGGSPKEFDPLIKKLRDLRLATIDMRRGWDGMMRSLQKVFEGGTKSINVFEGLSNQIRRLGVGENLIEMIVGMDPDEYNKRKKDLFVFDKGGNIVGVTAKLNNMQAAFNAIALGEYVNEQQRNIQSMRDQISAISILTANGLSLAEAYELVQNEALAAAIALGATREEIAEIIRLTKEVEGLRKKTEAEQERAATSKAVRKTNEDFEQRVAILNKLSKAAGQYSNAQIEAILGDSNLGKLFLDPKIDSRALEQALANAARGAQLEIDIKLASPSGRNTLFEEGFGKAMEALAIQEQTIDIDFRAGIADDESIIRSAESQIAALQFELDDYQAEITRIEDQEKDINDAYEKRFEALDKIAKSNEAIAAAQKSQLDIADALTRGDIAGAARAAREARSEQAGRAAQEERSQLERARDAQIAALTGRGGLNREQLEQQIRELEMQVFNLEEDLLEPAQERIRLAQELRDEQVRSLEVLGKTREEWEAIRNSVDVARMNNWEFVESMQRALDLVKQIIEDLGKAKPPPPPPPPPPAPRAASAPAPAPASAPKTTAAPASAPRPAPAPAPNASGSVVSGTAQERAAVGLYGTPVKTTPPPPPTRIISSPTHSSPPVKMGTGIVTSYITNTSSLSNAQLAAEIARDDRLARRNFSSGGMIIPKRMNIGGMVKGYAAGGFSMGSDIIPAMLTPGEFVVRKRAVQNFGMENLEKINSGTYNDGSVYNYNLAVNVKSDSDPDKIARTVMKHIDRVESQKIRGNKL